MLEDNGKVIDATDEDFVRVEDRRGGRAVLLPVRLMLALNDAAEAGERLEEALSVMLRAQARVAGAMAAAGCSPAAAAAFLDQAGASVRDFAEAFAAALAREGGHDG